MKTVIVSYSDKRGGASTGAFRLFKALLQAGVDVRMLVLHRDGAPVDESLSERIRTLKPAWCGRLAFLEERAGIFLHNGFSRKNLFKVSTACCGMSVANHPWVLEADIVNLHWINQGVLSLKEIGWIKAPVVWTMHDMWNMTGACHHAGECIGYMRECGNCRLLHGGTSPHDLSRHTYNRKKMLYDCKPIKFVAVSNWLARKAADSSLLSRQDVTVIPNVLPDNIFTGKAVKGREEYGLPADRKIIIMGAARLDDPVKGIDLAIETLNQLTDLPVFLLLFGDIRQPALLEQLKVPYKHIGAVSDPTTLADLYAHSDVVLSSSHYESFGLTLLEGQASGCFPVAFNHGGQQDIIEHLRGGWLATYPSVENLAEGIRYGLSGKVGREALREMAYRNFGAAEVARRYINLFNKITAQNN